MKHTLETKQQKKVVQKGAAAGAVTEQKKSPTDGKLSKVEEKHEKARGETKQFLAVLNKSLWKIKKEETNGVRLVIGRCKKDVQWNEDASIEFRGCGECEGPRVASFDVCPTGSDGEAEGCAECVNMLTDDTYFDKTRELLRKAMITMMSKSESLSGGMAKLMLNGDKPIVVLEDQELQKEQQTDAGKQAATKRRIENVRQLEGCSRVMFLNGGKDAKLTVDYQVVDGTAVREVHGRAGVRLEKFSEKVQALSVGTEETSKKLVKPLIQKAR